MNYWILQIQSLYHDRYGCKSLCYKCVIGKTKVINYHCQVISYMNIILRKVALKVPSWCSISMIWGLRKGQIGRMHTQNTASAPSHPIQHPTAGESTPLTPTGLVMAGCWQINSISTNIGHRNSIRNLNQYPFFWNILIWTQFICFINFFAF